MNRQLVSNALLIVVWVVLSVIGGWRLTYHIDDLFPGNMPDSVDTFIRFCLNVTGHSNLANPDHMATLALLLYWAMATLLVGGLIFIGNRMLRHYGINDAE